MRSIVPNIDVLAEDPAADTTRKERSLIEYRQSAEVVEHETHHVENRRRFKDNGVLPCWDLFWICRCERFLCRNLRQSFRIEVRDVRRVRLLPSRGIAGQHGDGNLARSLLMPFREST